MSRAAAILLIAVLIGVCCLDSARALAQDADVADSPDSAATASDETRAEALHVRGAAALLDARFAAARDFFRQAMQLVPNGGSAYNLALALRGTGESLAAIAAFEGILAGEFGPVSDERRHDIERWIVEERGALAVIELSIEGPAAAQLRVDGSELGRVEGVSPRRLSLDAGRRALSLRAEGYETREEVVFAARASEVSLRLTLTPLEEQRSVFERPAFWVVVGVLVLATVAAGVAIALGPYEESPQSEMPFGVATALRAAP